MDTGWCPSPKQLCEVLVRSLALDGAAVAMITDSGERDLVHATDPVIAHLDELQFTLAEGPCLDTHTQRAPVLVGDLDSAQAMDRWPVFAQEAARAGARAAFAFPMIAESVCFGVLELYRRTPGDLDPAATDTAVQAVGALSRVALAELVETTPVDGRALSWPPRLTSAHAEVHQAAGFLAVRLDLALPDAMARLRAAADNEDGPASPSSSARQVRAPAFSG